MHKTRAGEEMDRIERLFLFLSLGANGSRCSSLSFAPCKCSVDARQMESLHQSSSVSDARFASVSRQHRFWEFGFWRKPTYEAILEYNGSTRSSSGTIAVKLVQRRVWRAGGVVRCTVWYPDSQCLAPKSGARPLGHSSSIPFPYSLPLGVML